jgi:glutamate-ammonia-ligase adenylyltransferase
MTEFAQRAFERLESVTAVDLQPILAEALDIPNLDQALTNLERWLRATSSPHLYAQELLGSSTGAKLLPFLMGASQPIADTLIQNPEFASLIFERNLADRVPDRRELLVEGRRLLAATNSYSHALDRLRYLRQKSNLLTVLNDLAGTWTQALVWRALSDVADAIIELAVEVVWDEFRSQKGIEGDCPVMVVAFGKLAGHELNYSSDVDLVYVVPDGMEEAEELRLTRFCEMLTRALSDRMGRGWLYRVDLRLRPYGGAGPVVRSMNGYEAYYQRYAEPWEIQALVRTRPVIGSDQLVRRWQEMRERTCFKPKLSELALEEMLGMRDRIERAAEPEDLKRGSGGIRDVEFLTQVFQLVHGFQRSDVQQLPTLAALAALDERGWLEHPDAAALATGYTFLRRLEHRAQLVGDQQTHRIPDRIEAREALAKLMNARSWAELDREIRFQRRTIQSLYRSILKLEAPQMDARSDLSARLGVLGPSLLQWFDVLPESGAFYQSHVDNADSLGRVDRVLRSAPRLVNQFRNSVSRTELLLSGEIEEVFDLVDRLTNLPPATTASQIAETYNTAFTIATTQEILHEGGDLGQVLGNLADALIQLVCKRIEAPFDVIALGSLGVGDSSPASDADIVLLIGDPLKQREAERKAQELLKSFSELHRLGVPIQLDMRLRPDGGHGLLVRTFDGFRRYDSGSMEMWERFALGHARLIFGSEDALALVLETAYRMPLTPERLKELVRMKKRIETERVQPQHLRRNVKLGYGGLSDIEWLVHLHEMRFPMSMEAGTCADMDVRIRTLGRAHLMNAVEVEALQEAHRYLVSLRQRLYLLGQTDDLVPENPNRLDRLGQSLEFADGNAFLAHHERIIDSVRRLYTEGLERLRA